MRNIHSYNSFVNKKSKICQIYYFFVNKKICSAQGAANSGAFSYDPKRNENDEKQGDKPPHYAKECLLGFGLCVVNEVCRKEEGYVDRDEHGQRAPPGRPRRMPE